MYCRCFTYCEPHNIGVTGEVTAACAVTNVVNLHLRKLSEPLREYLDNSCASRRDQFNLNVRRVHRCAF